MAKAYQKDKSLKLAAAAVTLTFIVGLGGALLVESFLGLVILISLEAIILIGTGVLLSRTQQDKE